MNPWTKGGRDILWTAGWSVGHMKESQLGEHSPECLLWDWNTTRKGLSVGLKNSFRPSAREGGRGQVFINDYLRGRWLLLKIVKRGSSIREHRCRRLGWRRSW